MRQDPGPGRPLPVRATAIVLTFWTAVLLVIAFALVPLLFSVCGTGVTP